MTSKVYLATFFSFERCRVDFNFNVNVRDIQEYFVKYCQSNITMLWM